jgi:hypothetical protein
MRVRTGRFEEPGHLRPFAFETHGRFALLFVRSFTVSGYYDLC